MTHDHPISNNIANKQTDSVFIGIDVAKDSLAVYISSTKEDLVFSNREPEFEKLARMVEPLQPERIAIEATGGYQTPVLLFLAARGLPVSLVNPGQVRHFAKGLGQLAKTDKIDARILALFAEQVKPPVMDVPDEEQLELSALIRRREQILEMLAAEKNRLPLAHRSIKPGIKNHLEWFEKQLSDIDKDLDQAFKNSSLYKKAVLLESIPGVARVSSIALIAELPELGSLSNKQIAALAGVAPFTQSSGKWRGKQSIRQGRRFLRHKLYMAAFNAVRFNPVIRSFYQRLRDNGKPFKLAMVAAMRKLLCICNSIIRYQKPWQTNLT